MTKHLLAALVFSTATLGSALAAATELTVFKSPSCGCCSDWVEHLSANGIHSRVEPTDDIASLKKTLGIPTDLRSCHTGISENGFIFEGHVPARYIKQFLEHPPANAAGLSVPAMPAGSPGMEMGDHFMPYKVLLLKQDGSRETFASVNSPADQ